MYTLRREAEGRLALIISSADEIQSVLLDQATDSPDLGPPPTVNFNFEDPVKFISESEEPVITPSDGHSEAADLSANLEMRKRRRDGVRLEIHRSDPKIQREGDNEVDKSEVRKVKLPIRNAAKRKYHDRDNKTPETGVDISEEDFCFSRKGERLLEQRQDQLKKAWKEPGSFEKDNWSLSSPRKVLGSSK